ncbi:MAG: NADPH-dependent F420 reductase [Cellvibrionaceae bacterium]|jgi:NADPH-dependent F420 reductase
MSNQALKIAIIGPGQVGVMLATLWSQKGHQIFLGSREPTKAAIIASELGHNMQGMGIAQAAEQADILLFSFPWYALIDIEREIGKCAGKIIIDCINPITSSGSLALGHKRSAGEEIAQTFPLAKVIKAFNHIYVDHFNNPIFDQKPASAYYCSDDDSAKKIVVQLATEMGFDPVDIGPIKHARYLEPLALLWIQMAFHMGQGADFTFKMLKR